MKSFSFSERNAGLRDPCVHGPSPASWRKENRCRESSAMPKGRKVAESNEGFLRQRMTVSLDKDFHMLVMNLLMRPFSQM